MPALSLTDLANASQDTSDRFALMTRIARTESARTILELGVWEGRFAAHLLEACPEIESYWMLDPWRRLEEWNKPFNIENEPFEAAYQKAMAVTEFAAAKRRVLRGTTAEKMDEVPDGSLDLAYVDGDHTLRGAVIDLIRIWPKLRPGGLLIGDDFMPSIWQHSPEFEPSAVFPFAVHFAEAHDCPIVAIGHNQFAMRKGERGFQFIDPGRNYPPTALLGQIAPPRNRDGLIGRFFGRA